MNKKIKELEKDIKEVKIQGATNVALATLDGMRLCAKELSENDLKSLKEVGDRLSLARDNEPLARNAVRFVMNKVKKDKDISLAQKACDSYEGLIKQAKINIITYGTEALLEDRIILTHCHSSTATAILKNISDYNKAQGKDGFKVVSTETRPLYQGRKTAKKLISYGVDVSMIVDVAAAGFILDKAHMPVSALVVGCDELLKSGAFINKVGTFQMALAAKQDKDKFFVATTLLKLGVDRKHENPIIEQRDAKEIWDEAPEGLRVYNPAFEKVEADYVTGYITEAGVLKQNELYPKAKELYPWL